MRIYSKSQRTTRNLGARLAKKILKNKALRQSALVIGLVGNLGSGKTTFIKGFVKMFNVKQNVASPTFLIYKPYTIRKKNKQFKVIYHTDLYRISNLKELKALGFSEILKNPQYIVIIEWAEKLKNKLSLDTKWLYFSYGKKLNERVITAKTAFKK
jgi:tRNA threonylcarbamoyladenosine biosynthesis protein TsaE